MPKGQFDADFEMDNYFAEHPEVEDKITHRLNLLSNNVKGNLKSNWMLNQHGLQYDELPTTLTDYTSGYTSGDLASNSGGSRSSGIMQLPRYNMNFNVDRGASGSGNSGWLAPQTPYIVITRPELVINTDTYGHYYGYPSDTTTQLSTLTGFTKVGGIHLENIGCTKTEEGMLYSLLGSGVIINNFTVSKPGVFTIYVNNSDENVIGKSLTYLTSFSTIRLKNATSVNEPTFLLTDIDAVVGRMNYIYYPQFDRYYFIKEITSVRDGLWAVSCGVDVLETYKAQLANQTAIIERQEWNYNLYLNDASLKAYAKPYQVTLPFPVNFNMLGTSRVIIGLGKAPDLE